MDVLSVFYLLLSLLTTTECLDKQGIQQLRKSFNDSVSVLEDRVDCTVAVTQDRNGCLLKGTTDKCVILPSLKLLRTVLFPNIDLEKATGGFIKAIKLRVQMYALNICDDTSPFFQISLTSLESYELAERYLIVDQLNFNVRFSTVEGTVNNLADVSVTEGEAVTIINGNNVSISLDSGKGRRVLDYEFAADVLPLEEITKKFNLPSLEELFEKDVVDEKRLSTFQFIDMKAVGYSTPGKAFEFELSGKVNGPDTFVGASKVFLILQKYMHELKDVKCLLFALLQDQTPSTFYRISRLGEIDSNIPFLTPIDGKMALAISNADFVAFGNEDIKHTAEMFVGDSSGNIVNKGCKFLYRLQRMDGDNDSNSTSDDDGDDANGVLEDTIKSDSKKQPTPTSSTTTTRSITSSIKLKTTKPTTTTTKTATTTATTTTRIDAKNKASSFYHRQQYSYQQQQQQQSQQYGVTYRQPDSAKQYPYTQQKAWNPYQQNYQRRQYLSYPTDRSFYVRSKRDQDEHARDVFESDDVINDAMSNSSSSSIDENVSIQSQMKYLIFEMKLKRDSVIIKPKQNLTGDFGDMILYILGEKYASNRDSVPVQDDNEVYLDSVELSNVDNYLDVKIEVTQPQPLIVAPNFLELNNLEFSISRSISLNATWRVGKGSSGNDNSITDTEIIYDAVTKDYFITGDLEIYSQDELVNKTGQGPLPSTFIKTFPELTKFPYNNATFKMQLNKTGVGYTVIEAESLMFATKKVSIESVIWKGERIEGLTTGIITKNIDLNDFLFDLYDKRMLKICWMNMKDIVITFSTKRNDSTDKAIVDDMQGIDLGKNGSIVMKGKLDVNLKTGCLDEPVCNFIKNHILHDLSLDLEGNIYPTSYMLTSLLEGVSVSFGETWGVSQLMVTVAGTSEKDSGITLAGTIIHKETKRIGKFFVGQDKSLKRNTLEIIFETPWRSFMGFTMLTVTNMISEMDISSDEKLKHLSFSATMAVGNTKTPIVIENAIVLMDMKRKFSTEKDVIYGSLKNASMIQIEKAFKYAKLDPLSKKMSFNQELRVCFTNNDDGFEIAEFGNLKFSPSCNAIGNVKTFAGNVTAEFEMKNKLKFHFESKQLKYSDRKLILQKSEKNAKNGPEFTFELIPRKYNSTPTAYVKGYMKTIGHKGPVHARLQNNQFSHQFSSYLFDEAKMLVNITGRFDQNLNDTKYTAKLDQATALPEITRKLRHIIKTETASVNKDLIKKAEQLEKEILRTLGYVQNDQIKLTSSIDEKKSRIFQKRFAIEKSNELIKRDCSENCGKECVTALDWDRDCSTVRDQKFGCLKWKTCQAQASDTRCIAKCESKKIPATITAHEKRDDIRYLSEEIIERRQLRSIKEKLIRRGEKLHSESKTKTDFFKDRLNFLTSINPSTKALFGFTSPINPTSTQKLSNISPPCLHYDVIEYKFLSQIYIVQNKQICINGKYFKELANVILEGVDKNFGMLTDIKDQIAKDIINVQSKLEAFREKYKKQLEREMDQEEDEEDEDEEADNEGEDNTNTSQTEGPYELPHESSNLTGSVFSDAFPLFQAAKRSHVTEEEDENNEILEATEADIAHYVIKGPKTSAAFETDAPWLYMNKKRGITIPALGVLTLKNSSFDDHCAKRNDAIEHFEDLANSLNDIKQAYDEGKQSLEKEKVRLLNDKRDVDEEITNAKNSVQSIFERSDMIYWLKACKDGITEYLDSAEKQLEHQNNISLKYWLTQLDSAVRANIAHTPAKYFEKLKQNVLKSNNAAKRSKIAGEEALEGVAKEFISIAQKVPSISEIGGKLARISKQLDVFKRSSLTCAP